MIERQEFGHIVFPFLTTIFMITIFVLFCWVMNLQEYERKAEEKQEWLKYYTSDGLKYTFKNENNDEKRKN